MIPFLKGSILAGWLTLAWTAGADEFPHDRLVIEAKAHPDWASADNQRQLELIRDAALAKKTSSDPVSDRYTITFYGGPIDWVHFLNLAIFVYSGDQAFGEAQYAQWVNEGGLVFEAGKTREQPTASTPDDLPSNALGALFGKELRMQKSPSEVEDALERFIEPLRPVPDQIAKAFSHQLIVMGLPDDPSNRQLDRAYAWFTAEPLNVTVSINAKAQQLTAKPFGAPERSGRAALARADLRLTSYRGKLVVIERMSSP